MPAHFPYDVFLSHSAKDKAVVRPLAERLRQDGLKVWFNAWKIPVAASRQSAAIVHFPRLSSGRECGALPRRRYAEKVEEGLEHSRVVPLAHRMGEGGRRPGEGRAANAFGSYWAQLEAGTFRFRDTLNKARRIIARGWIKNTAENSRTFNSDKIIRYAARSSIKGDEFVQKITGSSNMDRPLQGIREIRNRPNPKPSSP